MISAAHHIVLGNSAVDLGNERREVELSVTAWLNVFAVGTFLAVVARPVVDGDWTSGGLLVFLGAISLLMTLASETFAEISAETWTAGVGDRSATLVRIGGFVGLGLACYLAWFGSGGMAAWR